MTGNAVPKELLLYWHQGWDRAPDLVKRCAATWLVRNPSWNVNVMDRGSIEKKVSIPRAVKALNLPLPAFADFIRTSYLKRGGYGRMPLVGAHDRWTTGSNPFAGRRVSSPMKSRFLLAL